MQKLSKIFKILSSDQKKKFYIISLLLFILTILEILGIGLIFPIISFLLNPGKVDEIINNYSQLNFLTKYDYSIIIISLMVVTGLFYFFKLIISILINFYKSKISYSLIASLNETMYNGYINQPLSFSVKKNSSYIIRYIIDYPSIFVNRVLLGVFTITFETIFVLATFIIFLKVNFQIGISIFIICSFFILIFFNVNKSSLKSQGKSLNEKMSERLKITRESLDGIRDLRIFNKKNFFKRIFDEHNYRIVSLTSLLEIKTILPRLLLEFFTILFILSSISYLLLMKNNINEVIPVITVIAAGMTKVIPSVSKIVSFLSGIFVSTKVIDEMFLETEKFKKIIINKDTTYNFYKEIKFNNVSYDYDENLIFNDINFIINKNMIFGLKGKSGSGKTTCLNLLSGFLNTKTGSITVDGKDIRENVSNWQTLIGYIPQKIFLIDDTIKQNICFGIENENEINIKNLENVSNLAELNNFINFPNDLEKNVGENGSSLSIGQIQRIGLARALYKNPEILILDETLNALDKDTQKSILNNLVKLKKNLTIIIVSHDENVLSMCSKVYNLENKSYN